MPTQKFNLHRKEWTKIANDGDEFLLETGEFCAIKVTYTNVGEEPEANAPFHLLKPKEAMVRVGEGDVYAMSEMINSFCVITGSTVEGDTVEPSDWFDTVPASGYTFGPEEDIVISFSTGVDKTYTLEVDHNRSAYLPEFHLYADSINPYGNYDDKLVFNKHGVTVAFDNGTWTMTYKDPIASLLRSLGSITYFLAAKNTNGDYITNDMNAVKDEQRFTFNFQE